MKCYGSNDYNRYNSSDDNKKRNGHKFGFGVALWDGFEELLYQALFGYVFVHLPFARFIFPSQSVDGEIFALPLEVIFPRVALPA